MECKNGLTNSVLLIHVNDLDPSPTEYLLNKIIREIENMLSKRQREDLRVSIPKYMIDIIKDYYERILESSFSESKIKIFGVEVVEAYKNHVTVFSVDSPEEKQGVFIRIDL